MKKSRKSFYPIPTFKPTILLTNDDGVYADGIWYLYDALVTKARVIIVAPEKEQSGVGHAFTFNTPLHYIKKRFRDKCLGYMVSGTPVDCVKFAISFLLPARPHAVVAGLNDGENSGLSAFYSGTVAAAREGSFWNVTSVAFSVCNGGEAFMKHYSKLGASIVMAIIGDEKGRKNRKVYYNVNFPACDPKKCRGIRITAQSLAFFDDRYETVEVASHQTKKGFVIFGEKMDIETSERYDSRALMNNYITITPLCFDATAKRSITHIDNLMRTITHKE